MMLHLRTDHVDDYLFVVGDTRVFRERKITDAVKVMTNISDVRNVFLISIRLNFITCKFLINK